MDKNILIENIKAVKNTRTDINTSDLSELMASIRENGLIHPISVFKNKDDKFYTIICGHRRYVALKKLGRKELVMDKEVKVLDEKLKPVDLLVLNLSENMHRLDNSPIELGNACLELKAMGLNNSEVAVRLAIPKSRIETSLRLIQNVPKKLRKDIGFVYGHNKNGKISASVANNIARLRIKQSDINSLFSKAKKQELSVGDITVYHDLIGAGMTVAEASKFKSNYTVMNLKFVVNNKLKEEFEGKGEKIRELIKDIIKGRRAPIKELLY